ncbi:NADH dehydrogenase [ubiquinone] 1 alpha subcomplex subunit 9, mitochondrial-like [Xenia sp. Carnegie-2017]|uniref:NADH dehydrogenase [ubiquinone] 1 alpha subcomplex subunit 9, mitochondrial-like n=1 Tax=Xenia sp. Carnegie-2017 TaxID=2897299 RepID=UPI001F0439C5|nr:NADH dehydrogenase [ubiquinone] 1 alpha subcomplex subunit 9, mitochondrial-like [Xenia sp. Carnegie-2017]
MAKAMLMLKQKCSFVSGSLFHKYVGPSSYFIQTKTYSNFEPKLGKGGRSSFSGVVATVFGATGFIGRYVVNRLGRVGSQVVIPYRGNEYDYNPLKVMGDLGQMLFFEYHLRDVDSVADMMKHSNVVINLIGKTFCTRNFTFDDCHVEGARTIARAAKQVGVHRFIHVSALNANEESTSQFLQSKARGEKAVREEFPDAIILRPSDVYGHEDKYFNYYSYFRNIPFGVPLIDGGMNTRKRPVFVVDVAKAIINSMYVGKPGNTYELFGPKEYFLFDLLDYIYRMNRRKFRHYNLPRPLYNLVAWAAEQSIFDPRLTRDMLFRQFNTDVPTEGLPRLQDLGIEPTAVDKAAITVLRRHRDLWTFEEALDEEEKCKPTTAYV